MDARNAVPDARCWGAIALAGASLLATTLCVGLAIGGYVPPSVPAYVGITLSLLVLALNLAAISLAFGRTRCLWIERLAACGVGLVGPCLTAFAWSGGGWGTLVWVGVLLVLGLVASVLWVAGPQLRMAEREADSPVSATTAAPGDVTTRDSSMREDSRTQPSAPASDAAIVQRMERSVDGGEELIAVEWRVEFAAGETSRAVHLPITPPLAAAPEVECEPLDDAEVDVTVGACHAYGVRLDVRRTGPSTAATGALIGVQLRSPAAA